MLGRNIILVLGVGIIPQTVQISAYVLLSGNSYACQGSELYLPPCRSVGQQSYIRVKSVTVLTNHNAELIINETLYGRSRCAAAEECRRTIHSSTDVGLSPDYRHLFEWVVSSCQGKIECNATGSFPEYWNLIDDRGECRNGTQYFASVIIDYECRVGDNIPTVAPPLSTTPREIPTIPTTTPKTIYLPTALGVCAGGYYELGCGVADGTQVMNVTQLNLLLDNEEGAFQCSRGGLCHIQMGGENGDIVTAQPLLNLFRSIQANCHGKPMCTGTLPPYSDVAVYLPEGSYFHVCGWNNPEYLSYLDIVSRCQDAGSIETLPPYEYEVPGNSAMLPNTTTPTTTPDITTPSTTTPSTTTPDTISPSTTTPDTISPVTSAAGIRCTFEDRLYDSIYTQCRLHTRLFNRVLEGCRYFTAPRCHV